MADDPVLNRLSGFASQPVTGQLSLLIGMVASVVLGVGLVHLAVEPGYEPLFGVMSSSDTATAINTLQTNGIPYELERGTSMLLVPYDQVLRARMMLASEGFPRSGGFGYDVQYEEQQTGFASFREQARYRRAAEAELARTIATIDSVSAARVRLTIAKQPALTRRGDDPSASTMLNLKPGLTVDDRQLGGIIHLVASSIPNLDASRVSVVDQTGTLLSDQGADNDFGHNANANTNQQSNQPPVVDNHPARESRSFEVNKKIADIREAPGSLSRLSVVVLVDYVLDDDGNKVALDQARIEQIKHLVREAVGFDQARGDTLTVINSPFVAPAPVEPIPEPSFLEQGWVWQAARSLGAAVALLLIFLMVVRPLIRYSTRCVARAATRSDNEDQRRVASAGEQDDAFDDDTESLGGSEHAALQEVASRGVNDPQIVAKARNVANEQPARAAHVIRNWMAADG